MPDSEDSQEKQRRQFYRICIFSTCLGFGVLAAAIESVQMEPEFDFIGSWWTILAFFIGVAIAWLLWKLFFFLVERKAAKHGADGA